MSCTVSEMPSGCRLRGMSSTVAAQNVGSVGTSNSGSNSGGGGGGNGGTGGNGGVNSSINTGGIHVGGMLNTTSALNTTSSSNNPRESSSAVLQRQRHPSQKPCCFCWCWCCTCSWSKCLQLKGAEDGGLGKGDAGSAELLLDGEQPSLDEIRGWGKSFDKLMKSNSGRKIFRDFLRSEFSEENILFWLACEELKKESSADVIEEKARLIYEDYISILSPREVSLDSRVREIVNKNMVEPTPNTFDEAQIQIYTLMHRDSYPRFLNSQKFKTLAQLTDGMSTAGSISESPT